MGLPMEEEIAGATALTAAEVVALVGGALDSGEGGRPLAGAAIDSRAVAPGMLFVALAGTRIDGHRYVGEALRRGAGGALVSQPVPDAPREAAIIRVPDALRAFHRLARGIRDRRTLRVVGITGSVGKTSTKEMAAAVSAQRFRTARTPENWNTELGVPLVLANLPADREVAVLELAMRGPGQIRELVEISGPNIGVITNVGESHMDFFPSREALAAAKGELLEGLPADGVAVLNADDPLAMSLAPRTRARILSFGGRDGDVRASAIEVRPERGSRFRLHTPSGDVPVALGVPGSHSILNALAAAAVGVALGVGPEAIARGLAEARPLPRRLEPLRVGEITLLNDVYNSSPQSMRAAFDTLDEIEGAPRIAVLGDMKELGVHAVDAHERVGREVARRRIDLLIAFGPLAATLAAAARAAGGPRVVHTDDPDAVVALLRTELIPGAVALIKGSRAMEMERITEALRQPEPTRAPGKGSGA
jgi:UDP-N-acetylmuramoyl-tripeptide--D-alanyl-D-alanine ligase